MPDAGCRMPDAGCLMAGDDGKGGCRRGSAWPPRQRILEDAGHACRIPRAVYRSYGNLPPPSNPCPLPPVRMVTIPPSEAKIPLTRPSRHPSTRASFTCLSGLLTQCAALTIQRSWRRLLLIRYRRGEAEMRLSAVQRLRRAWELHTQPRRQAEQVVDG